MCKRGCQWFQVRTRFDIEIAGTITQTLKNACALVHFVEMIWWVVMKPYACAALTTLIWGKKGVLEQKPHQQ